MEFIDWIILIAVALVVGLIIGVAIWKKATGRSSGCGCDCSSCSGCPSIRKCEGNCNLETREGEENAKA